MESQLSHKSLPKPSIQKNLRMSNSAEAQEWARIVRAVDSISCEEVNSIRVLLKTLFSSPAKPTLRGYLRTGSKLLRHLILPWSRLPAVTPQVPLFAFIYGTASNVNNLAPVYQAA